MFTNWHLRQYSMQAWKVASNCNEIHKLETKIPTVSSPSDVLVKVHSTTINPLDARMRNGYGRRVLDILNLATNPELRLTNDRYPLTLGRDFSGTVVSCGPNISQFKKGDAVFGSVEPQRSGTHAQYVTVPSYCLTNKPANISHNQAAAIPFAALTAWSALCTFGRLSKDNCHGKSVLVIGGSGGVGSLSIQLLKLWGARVTGTCAAEKIEWLLNELHVDDVADHNNRLQMDALKGRFDFVLDCGDYDKSSQTLKQATENSIKFLKPYKNSVHVTLSPPFLKNTDEQGLVLGTAKSALDAAIVTLRGSINLTSTRWAFYLPNKTALDYITKLLSEDTIRPFIWKEFSFEQMKEAYHELSSGTAKGKIVVSGVNE